MTPNASRIEDGIEICNTCVRPIDKPYCYAHNGGVAGCVSRCHDEHVRKNTKPGWMAPRYVLPAWILEARRGIALAMKEGR
jgi:hypothetical protein